MRTCSLLLVGLEPPQASVATEAARSALPGGRVSVVSSLDEALGTAEADGPAVLVLSDLGEADLARASQALDSARLPRWAVVLIRAGSPDPDVEAVAPTDWNSPVVGRVLRLSAASCRLRREVAALRGDLLTFGLRIAHDLRTPLGGIAVTAETLKDALQERSPEERALVKPIFDSSDELAALIRQVSMLAKATARPVPQEHLPMGTVVWAALERLRPAIAECGASVSEPKSWPNIVGDAVSLEAVWGHLLSNALVHSGKKPQVELGWEKEGAMYKFWVRDHGPGVPAPSRGLLFHPFHRMHEPNAMRGLGLSISQRLVELLGGTCGYEPQTSGGSRFYFTIPARAGPGKT